jgi:hypothetical protein
MVAATLTEPFLLTEQQAAHKLSLCPGMVSILRKRGEIPWVPVGRAVRYDPADLRAWIERKKDVAVPDNKASIG